MLSKINSKVQTIKKFEVAEFVYHAAKSFNKIIVTSSPEKTLTLVFLLVLCFQRWKLPCPVPSFLPLPLGLSEIRDGVTNSILLLVTLSEILGVRGGNGMENEYKVKK